LESLHIRAQATATARPFQGPGDKCGWRDDMGADATHWIPRKLRLTAIGGRFPTAIATSATEAKHGNDRHVASICLRSLQMSMQDLLCDRFIC
jgi:hypothetical protein